MEKKVAVTKNGPYLVSGKLPLAKEIIECGKEGPPETWKKGQEYPDQESYALCRCGHSTNKPFCTGMHAKTKFDGTETASREKYDKQAETLEGPALVLKDAQDLCSGARFCHRAGGVWKLTNRSDDKASKEIAIQEACNCPSGRLTCCDKKTGKAIETEFKPSIGIVEDPQAGASGPIWVRGGVPIQSADGKKYEIRNRVTLCRCGKSGNKPFCDGTHIEAKFNDGDESLDR